MGKGNRSRADRAEEIIANADPALTKKQKKTNKVTILVTVIVVVVIAFFALVSLCVSNGWLQRSKTAVSSDNFRVSGTMMPYFVQGYYLNELQPYASYFGIDTDKPLYAQDAMEGVTWAEYIAAKIQENVKQKLALCEAAKKDGMELTKENRDNIDVQINGLKDAAKQQYMSANQYCANVFGAGVSVNDVEAAMELDLLAQQYYEKLYNENEEDLKKDGSDAELKKYVDEHPEVFLSACTLQYPFTAKLTTVDAEATETETAAYAADKAKMNAKAEAIKSAATSEEAFKAALIAELCGESGNDAFEAAYITAFKSVAEEELPDSATLADAKEKILDYCQKAMQGDETAAAPEFTGSSATEFTSLCSSVYSTLVTNGYEAMDSDVAYSNPTDSSATALAQWLFADGRKAGDAEVIVNEGDSTSTYTVVFVKEAAALDETPTRDVAHILVSSSAQANEILAKFNAGEKTLDAFKALGEGVTQDSSIVYEKVYKGKMVAEFEGWLFAEDRKEGDAAVVQSDYGYHVMYYIGENEATWKYQAREYIVSDRLTDWLNEAVKTYNVKANEKFFVDLSA